MLRASTVCGAACDAARRRLAAWSVLLDRAQGEQHLVAKGGASRYVPILPSLAQELRTHLQARRSGYLFESNRRTHYAVRRVQTMVAA